MTTQIWILTISSLAAITAGLIGVFVAVRQQRRLEKDEIEILAMLNSDLYESYQTMAAQFRDMDNALPAHEASLETDQIESLLRELTLTQVEFEKGASKFKQIDELISGPNASSKVRSLARLQLMRDRVSDIKKKMDEYETAQRAFSEHLSKLKSQILSAREDRSA